MKLCEILANESSHKRCCPPIEVLEKLQAKLSPDDFEFVLQAISKNLMIPLGPFHKFEKLFPDYWKYKKE